MQLKYVGIIRKPGFVPVIDPVKVAGVVEAVLPSWDGSLKNKQ